MFCSFKTKPECCNSLHTSAAGDVILVTAHDQSSYPTIVPIPTSLSTVTPATEANNSGAEEPAAMKVAPATSSERSSFSEIASSDGTKKSSQTMASAAT